MITQKDLREIARVLRNLKPSQEKPVYEYPYLDDLEKPIAMWKQWVDTIEKMSDMLSSNNPKFKRRLFYKASGYEEEHNVQNSNI